MEKERELVVRRAYAAVAVVGHCLWRSVKRMESDSTVLCSERRLEEVAVAVAVVDMKLEIDKTAVELQEVETSQNSKARVVVVVVSKGLAAVVVDMKLEIVGTVVGVEKDMEKWMDSRVKQQKTKKRTDVPELVVPQETREPSEPVEEAAVAVVAAVVMVVEIESRDNSSHAVRWH